MNRIKVGGAAATFIGGLCAVLATIYGTSPQEQSSGFAAGLAVAVAGAGITVLATWLENRR